MNRFTDKVVIVTGAAAGIGKACVERLGAEGARIFALDVSQEGLDTLSAELSAANVEHRVQTCDISDEAEVQSAVAACAKEFGAVDALVHMAGILRWDNTHELELADWKRLIDINVTGTFIVNKAVLPHLVQSNGNIVNCGSTTSLAGLPYAAAYAASKGAVRQFTRSIAIEYAKRGVRANCVIPGDISTGMTADIDFPDGMDMTLLARSASLTGPATPDVIANMVALVASDEGRHINGADLRVDGGSLA